MYPIGTVAAPMMTFNPFLTAVGICRQARFGPAPGGFPSSGYADDGKSRHLNNRRQITAGRQMPTMKTLLYIYMYMYIYILCRRRVWAQYLINSCHANPGIRVRRPLLRAGMAIHASPDLADGIGLNMSRRVTTKEDVVAVIALFKADHDTSFISEQTGVAMRFIQNLIK